MDSAVLCLDMQNQQVMLEVVFRYMTHMLYVCMFFFCLCLSVCVAVSKSSIKNHISQYLGHRLGMLSEPIQISCAD